MRRHISIVMLLISFVSVVHGQSAADLAQRFPHYQVYEVKPGVVMSAQYSSSGSVCEMRVEQSHFSKDAVDLRTGLDLDKMNALLDHLVPASERGAKQEDDFSKLISITGPVSNPFMSQTERYENVTVETIWLAAPKKKALIQTGPAVLVIKWHNRPCS